MPVLLILFECYQYAHAVKPGACMSELEATRTELRLRTAELLVARGQVRACERR